MINLFVSTRGRLKSKDYFALFFVFILLLQSCKVFEAQEAEEESDLSTTLPNEQTEAVTVETTSPVVVEQDPDATVELMNEENDDNSIDDTETTQQAAEESSDDPDGPEAASNQQPVDENSIGSDTEEPKESEKPVKPEESSQNDARYLLEQEDYESSCYDPKTGIARKCMPDFINAAFGLKITVSNTCGVRSITEYCVQTNAYGSKLSGQSNSDSSVSSSNSFLSRVNSRCQKCDAADPRYAHPADYLNDYNNPENLTWWQSETMLEDVQSPNSVNLTLNLGKSFEINYIQLKFHSPRPESFAIYKRTVDNGPWVPYQFYSASCYETYGLEPNEIVQNGHEAVALCTDEFSDIAPLTGTSVVFGTLEDRPSAYDFENSDQLKEWVTATEIRISLDRLNTFGDEVFNDPQVLKSYYYAISDVAVGGWCKCNGHARRCVVEQQEDFEDRLTCKCEHFTDGVDCEKCLPFYNDRPWAPASDQDANECQMCSCNGLSSKCFFNQTLYDQTHHGGHCYDCDGNTEGPHCDICKVGFYRRDMNDIRCVDCQCNSIGSESMQCDPFGRCKCKPGVVGDKCDRCAPYHYELSVAGCKPCTCNPTGSYDVPPVCDPRDGSCRCKLNIEGRDCDRPKPGHYHLSDEHVHGAMPCFCYAHSSVCNSSIDYFISQITAQYDNYDSSNRWKSIDSRGRVTDVTNVGNGEVVQSVDQQQDDVWFLLPKQFLGDQLHSYNQDLTFTIRLVPEVGYNVSPMQARPSRKDIVIENAQYNLEIYMPIYGGASASNGRGGQLPSNEAQVFAFKLIQYGQNGGWMPTLSTIDFQRLLTNISAIKIRASYVPNTRAILSKINLGSAKLYSKKTELDEVELDSYGQMNRKELKAALYVEQCKCPLGHIGQHCERCAEGYRREPVEGGPFARCVPCNCNYHSLSCDSETGRCDCLHHTSGDNCEKCEEGYYGNPLVRPSGSSSSPQLNPTSYVASSPLLSIELAVNSGSNGNQIAPSETELANMCKKCPCVNDGPCAEIYNYQLERTEVVCLACPPGTQGNLCELCDDGFYAVQLNSTSTGALRKSALTSSSSLTAKTCEKCTCNGNVDENAIGNCDQVTGICLKCVYNTTGDQCQKCLPNHWGNALTSVKCHACECDYYGTIRNSADNTTRQCNLQDGQCDCLPNIRNRQCDQCKDGYWNIRSGEGCELCKCNPLGSYNLTCDIYSGQCHCRPGVTGLKCDACKPLHYGFSDDGCKACECDPYGIEPTAGLQCDDFGKCRCKNNFAGIKCNKCEENYYNFTSGCHKCDECYDLVQKKIGVVRTRILTIQSSLNNLLSSSAGSLSVNEQTIQLQRKLDSLRNRVESYHQELYQKQSLPASYKESLDYFRNEIKTLVDQLKNLDQLFDQFNSAYRQAERLYAQVNGSVTQVHTQLNFIRHKNDDQRSRLDSVKKTRQSHDQNVKLQGFAKHAREQAELQENQAQEAQERLRRMINDAYSSIKELQDLVGKYDRMQADRFGQQLTENYEAVKQSANSLVTEAREQKTKLEDSIKEVNQFIKKLEKFEVPDEKKIDGVTKDWTTSLEKFNNKVVSLKSEVDQVKSKFERFSDEELLRLIGTAQTQLNNAKLKQRDIDYLYGLAERVRNESESAIAMANQVHDNATRILDTLKNFDEIVADGKQRVKNAEELKTVIEQNVLETHGLVYKLREKVDTLRSKIEEIKRRTYDSENTLREANHTFEQLQQKVTDLKQSAKSLQDKTDEMVKNFTQTTQSKVDQAVEVQKNLNERSDSVLKQADEVANRTQRLLDDANNGLEGLNRINKSLSDFSVSNIRKEDITRLQTKFNELSSQLDGDKQIDENISNLEKSGKYLLNTAKQYRYQVELLRKEIENLEQINSSLERKCFANTFAKPEL